MKKLQRLVLTAACFPLLLFSCGFAAQSNEPPCLELSADSMDIGSVRIDEEPRAFDIELRNTGGQDLIITNIETSCHCTTVDYPREPIKGGRSATLHLTFSAKDFFPSDVLREVQIFSNTADSPKLFYFKVKVAPQKVSGDVDVYPIYY